jgi:DNA-binding winged helix-turn-helix (wHTH) protein
LAPILPILASAALDVFGRNEISDTILEKREVDESAGGKLSEAQIMHQSVSLTTKKRRL